MNQAVLIAILQMLLGFLQVLSYALLVFWAFRIFKSLPLERYFKKVSFYHLLVPALALASLAYTPLRIVWELLFSFPLDFSRAWVPPLLKFFEGLGFLGLLIYLVWSMRTGAVRAKLLQTRRWRVLLVPLAIVFLLAAVLGGTYYYLSRQGYIVKFSIFRPEYLDYQNESPRFSFSYPSRFVLDKDEENRFGESYLVGIKLPSDNRVGCDVRAIKGKLSLEGEVEEVAGKLAEQISKDAKEFKVLGSSFMEIGEEKAIKLEITFKGPLGETMRTDQVFISHGDKVYTLICGTTKDTFEFFAEDFSYFFDHFSF